MKKIKIIGYGGGAEQNIINNLKGRVPDFVKFDFESYDLADTDTVFVIASFRKKTKLVTFLLENAEKIKKLYELIPFSFEGKQTFENTEKTHKELSDAGIEIKAIMLDELLTDCSKETTVKESIFSVSNDIFDDISAPLNAVCGEFLADIKQNMLTYVKDLIPSEFTYSKILMSTADRYGMTPPMYFTLCGTSFDTSNLNDEDKEDILSKKNIFGHNIVDIASLKRFEQYMDMRMLFDFDFAAKEKEYLDKLNTMKLEANRLESKAKEPTVISFFRKLFTQNKALDNQIQLQILKNEITATEEKHNADLQYEYNEKMQNVIIDIEENSENADIMPIIKLYCRRIKLVGRLKK